MTDAPPRRGLMYVMSSPSGAGKTTITRALLARNAGLALSISATTRPMRAGEADGVDYFFVTPQRFARMVEGGEMLEHATVFGRHYGTPRAPVEAALAAGRDVAFDIDWQGTQQLADRAREDVVSVFILPPTRDALAARLKARAATTGESAADIGARMAEAGAEMSHAHEYDYVIINTDVSAAIAQAQAILDAERARRHRVVGLANFVRGLKG
ncbi:MAG: guanylate kinase [Alphaproteobacteria bacterium]|jgi:guanylate kinase|nr:guanylate kinase [Alphaproteobacteria bacterium]